MQHDQPVGARTFYHQSAPEPVTIQLLEMVNRISSLALTVGDCDSNLFHLGIDSLMLARFRQMLHQDLGVDLELSRFYSEADTISKIAAIVLASGCFEQRSCVGYPDDKSFQPVPESTPEMFSTDAPHLPRAEGMTGNALPETGGSAWLQEIFHRQLEAMSSLMTNQLALLNEWGGDNLALAHESGRAEEIKKKIDDEPLIPSKGEKNIAPAHPPDSLLVLSLAQMRFISNFTMRYNEWTAGSKRLTQTHRSQFCDWIQAIGFRPELKDCIYPIACARSEGAYFWDIDGNSYIDLAMGYGVSFLGHRPPVVVDAVTRQLTNGFHLGPQFDQTGAVARLICEMTGVERVAFTNTGTEAIMAAVRIARAVTGRPLLALFAGSYHGTFDGVLAEADGERPNALPRSAGTPPGMVADVIVLNYGDIQALEIIRQNSQSLAAVLVEPVQSRRPGFHPHAFLQQLRQITTEFGIALIFDEVITGFRIHPGGAQAYFNVCADLVTYGKVLGGGMPIGVVAGKAKFLDAVDGGFWSFGDKTSPQPPKLLFAGTFSKHPLAMSAAKAVLEYLQYAGPSLQEDLNRRVSVFAIELNAWFEKERAPIQLRHFGSLFRFESFGPYDLALAPIEMDIFFLLLLYRGVYTWERRICFFSTVHSDADMEHVKIAVQESIREMRAGGFAFDISPIEKSGHVRQHQKLPASSVQKRLFVLSLMESGEGPYHLTGSIMMDGFMDKDRLQAAFQTLCQRHESLRTGFEIPGSYDQPGSYGQPGSYDQQDEICQLVFDSVDAPIEYARIEPHEAEDFARHMIRPFDLSRPPLARMGLAEISENKHLLIFDMHHLIGDGISGVFMVQELVRLYMGESLQPVTGQYRDYVQWEKSYLGSETCSVDKAYWRKRLDQTVPLNLPLDFPRPDRQQFHGRVLRQSWNEEDTRQLKLLARSFNTTPYMLMLAIYTLLLHRLSGQTDILVGTTTSGRLMPAFESTVGAFVNTLVMRNFPDGNLAFDQFVLNVTQNCLRDFSHQGLPFEILVESIQIPRDIRRNMLFDTLFVYENVRERSFQLPGMTITQFIFDRHCAMFDLTLEIIEKETIQINLEYNIDLFKEATAAAMLKSIHDILLQVAVQPQILCQDIAISSLESSPALAALTDHQSRLWFVDRFEAGVLYPHSPVYYNMPLILRCKGPLQITELSDSLQFVVNRHSALRTSIVGTCDPPGQIVMDKADIELRVLKLEGEYIETMGKLLPLSFVIRILEDAARPFQLDQAPLVRAAIISVDAENYILALTAHHIICDPWSLEQVAVQWLHDYQIRLKRQFPPSQPPPAGGRGLNAKQEWDLLTQISYSQFPAILKQNAFKEDPTLMKVQQQFWTECLAKDCQPLNLPTDHPRPAIQTYQSGFLMFLIPENLVSALRKLATNLDASMTTVFLTAFNILLFRYTGQIVVITGAPCPCRSDDRLAEAVGPFANLLVIKANFQDDPTVADMVFQMHRYWDQAMANQQFPFDRLVQVINPDKDMSRTALFDVLFNCREDLPILPSGPDFSAQIIHTHHGWGKYDLTLGLQVQGQEATGSLVYNKDIFEADTINRMLNHFLTILSQMTCQPDIPVSRLQILTQEEYDYHSFSPLPTSPRWGEESERLPQDKTKTLHELFADQALHHPDRLAVTWEDERLTYRQLNFRANELASLLNECGIGPDQIVGICLEKSPDIIVAIIGILKAGGAYLPLDPSLPQERLAFMLQDAGVRIILTCKSLQNRFANYFELGTKDYELEIRNYESGITDGNQLVFLSAIHNLEDAPTLLGAPHPSAASLPIKEDIHSPIILNSASALDNLAYVIYTSGSTGTPKGVLITHRQVVNLMVNDESDFNFSDQDIWTLFHAFSFDFSVWEMFGALLYGGCITIVPHLTAQDPRQFLKLLKLNQVTVLNQTPTAFYALIPHIVADFEQGGDSLALRYVIFGGESLAPWLLKPFRTIYPQVKLVNMYGITETTVHVTFKELNDMDIQTNTRAIGRPLPGLRVHVLDKHLQPVPVGVWGELCVAGNGLARGYLNRPELTVEKFTVLPWQPRERIYRSGDLGRWRSDGDLEYLGRADDQVKIRGYRIETREVVHHFLAHPDIKQAVVLPHEDFDGSKNLRAYIVADHPLKAADLRQHLQARLPEYMLPRLFHIPQIPMTANGKVDAAACAGLNPLELEPEDPFQPARNEMEAQMVAVWQAVLGRERISIHDNFFELGGHSLKAAQVVFRLQQILEKEIGLRDFFSAPSISALAAVLQQRGTRQFPAIVPAPDAPHYELSYSQRRLWVVDQVYGDSPAYHIVGAFLLKGRLELAALKAVFQTLVDRHESLRTVFITVGSEPRQKILSTLNITLEEKDFTGSAQPETDAYKAYLAETVRSFDLKQGPLLRVQLLRLPDIDSLPRQVMIINLHHIISDGWSIQVMIREMSAIYQSLSRGQHPASSPLTIQYKDYAHWQHQQMKGPAMLAHRQYWINQLTPPPPDMSLHLDFPRPNIQSHQGGRLRFTLAPELVRELARIEQASQLTQFMVFATGVTILLYCHSRCRDVCVGTPVAGRIHSDLETQIGFYLNILVLRTKLDPDHFLSQIMTEMGKTVAEALDHQAYPFDLLVEDLKLKRDPARHPLFDVMIILQNNTPAKLNWEGIQVSSFADESIASQFDLKFTVEPGSDLIVAIEYNPDLFRDETIQILARDLRRILEFLTKAPMMTANMVMQELRPKQAIAEEAAFLNSTLSTDEIF